MSMKKIKSKSVYCGQCKKETLRLLRVTIPDESRGMTENENSLRKRLSKSNDYRGLADLKRKIRLKLCSSCIGNRIATVETKTGVRASAYPSLFLAACNINKSKRELRELVRYLTKA